MVRDTYAVVVFYFFFEPFHDVYITHMFANIELSSKFLKYDYHRLSPYTIYNFDVVDFFDFSSTN